MFASALIAMTLSMPAGPVSTPEPAPVTIDASVAQDPWGVALGLHAIKNGPAYFSSAIDWGNKLRRAAPYIRKGNLWPLWACQYADGTIVYNKFRAYRTAGDVMRHFSDQTKGDRDAYTYAYGGKQHIRYGRGGNWGYAMIRRHGKIVSVFPCE